MAIWRQGEHVALVGDTGSGKTYLEERLLSYRRYVIVLRTKPDDNPFTGFHRARSVREIGSVADRYVLQPPYRQQRAVCAEALDYVWRAGRWCIAIDELYYVDAKLKLSDPVDLLLTQGRSKKISVVCGMQRPSRISRFALSQPTHWFIFRCEGRDVKTLIEAGTPAFKDILPNLRRYEFCYWNRVTGELAVGKAENLGELLG